ncbi:hypothetical protein HHX47_DHR5001112, partial [Lentinula edodes]
VHFELKDIINFGKTNTVTPLHSHNSRKKVLARCNKPHQPISIVVGLAVYSDTSYTKLPCRSNDTTCNFSSDMSVNQRLAIRG